MVVDTYLWLGGGGEGVPTLWYPFPLCWPGWGQGCTYLGWGEGVLPWGTLPPTWPGWGGGYLPWTGLPTLGYPLPILTWPGGGGTYLGVPLPLSWPGWGSTYLGLGLPTLGYPLPPSWPGRGGVPTLGYPSPVLTDRHMWKHNLPSYYVRGR